MGELVQSSARVTRMSPGSTALLALSVTIMTMTDPGHAAPGFFYSTGYYPFGHVSPASLAYYHYSPVLQPVYQPFPLVEPAVSYAGCRNVLDEPVPCALPSVETETQE